MDLLQVKDLSIEFRVPSGAVKAVNGVTFAIKESTTVAIVGESGSGKSTIAQAVLGILPNVATITGGEILFRDQKQKSTENNGFFNGEITLPFSMGKIADTGIHLFFSKTIPVPKSE